MRAIDLTNRVVGELKALRPVERTPDYKSTSKPWLCLCSCGREVVLPASEFNAGRHTHCGCKFFQFKPGMRFGNWTVSSVDQGPKTLCVCECGEQRSVSKSDLYSGKSRGCVSCGHIRKGYDVPLGMRQVRNAYVNNAKQKGREFSLSLEECHELFQAPCHYCGSAPMGRLSGKLFDYFYNGLDRKDNSRGYVRDNVVPCCKVCNRAKHSMGYDEFMEWVRAVAKRHYGSDLYA